MEKSTPWSLKALSNSRSLCAVTKQVTHHALVAQFIEHQAVTQKVVSSTLAGQTLRVLK